MDDLVKNILERANLTESVTDNDNEEGLVVKDPNNDCLIRECLIIDELGLEGFEELMESYDGKELVRDGILLERAKLTTRQKLEQREAQALTLAILSAAKEANDPEYRKYKKLLAALNKSADKMGRKYHSKAKKRVKENRELTIKKIKLQSSQTKRKKKKSSSRSRFTRHIVKDNSGMF